jgi:uncharacterized protein (TIGR02598 family)
MYFIRMGNLNMKAASTVTGTSAKRSNRGFSLVEVTLSLSLVSFAFVAVLGLLPTGLTTLRDSMNQTVEAQILQSISSRAVISRFTNLTDNTLYFDDEGLPVETATNAYYTVNVTTDDASFPGSTNAVALGDSLKNLNIAVEARRNPAARGKTTHYSLQIANSGK